MPRRSLRQSGARRRTFAAGNAFVRQSAGHDPPNLRWAIAPQITNLMTAFFIRWLSRLFSCI